MLLLMPYPTSLENGEGEMLIGKDFRVSVSGPNEPRLEQAALRLIERMAKITGVLLHHGIDTGKEDTKLHIQVEVKVDDVQGAIEDESYSLEINTKDAVLKSNTVYGSLRGIETFMQLIRNSDNGFSIPALRILDQPRFPWRGLLIDSSRHFITKEVIIRNLEAMALVKLNVLHWHLSNDQGFRVESKVYPRLHELGSNNLYYTHEDIQEIIEFAAERGIRVMPDFTMPPHTTGWLIGYPHLASSGGPFSLKKNWGAFETSLDPTKESTYEFLQHFFTEMAALFPDHYVHIGGDQIDKNQWQAISGITEFMANNQLDNMEDLHTYFNIRVHSILADLGKGVVGWGPIIHNKMPKDSLVQTVAERKFLSRALTNGFRVINSYHYYIDLLEPAQKIYSGSLFEEDGLKIDSQFEENIIGGEATMWSEFVDSENIDLRIWPRTAAVAERLWSSGSFTDSPDVEYMYNRMEVIKHNLKRIEIDVDALYLQRLAKTANHGSIEALELFAEVVCPIFEKRWKDKSCTTESPLNRLVDTALPDSAKTRWFSKNVEVFIKNPSDSRVSEELIAQFKIWQTNHKLLVNDLVNAPLLTEILPLSEKLKDVSVLGEKLVRLLNNNLFVTKKDSELNKQKLKDAQIDIADLKLIIIPDCLKLNAAVQVN